MDGQAHALEQVGGSGFFTMKHKAVGVGESIRLSFSSVDAHTLKKHWSSNVPLLLKHWTAMLKRLGSVRRPQVRRAEGRCLLAVR